MIDYYYLLFFVLYIFAFSSLSSNEIIFFKLDYNINGENSELSSTLKGEIESLYWFINDIAISYWEKKYLTPFYF